MQQSVQTDPIRDHESMPVDQEPKGQGRVLVVEDALCIQVLISTILRKMNLDLEIAENGQRACELAEKSKAEGKPYDLILMDIGMPHMNGYDATRWLRQHSWKGSIVAVTAYDTDEDHKKCLDAGCDAYLSKPFTEMALRNIVTQHLSGTHRIDLPERNVVTQHLDGTHRIDLPESHTPIPDQQAPPQQTTSSESVQDTLDANPLIGLIFDTERPLENLDQEIEFL